MATRAPASACTWRAISCQSRASNRRRISARVAGRRVVAGNFGHRFFAHSSPSPVRRANHSRSKTSPSINNSTASPKAAASHQPASNTTSKSSTSQQVRYDQIAAVLHHASPSRIGQPCASAWGRSRWSGQTATGWPTRCHQGQVDTAVGVGKAGLPVDVQSPVGEIGPRALRLARSLADRGDDAPGVAPVSHLQRRADGVGNVQPPGDSLQPGGKGRRKRGRPGVPAAWCSAQTGQGDGAQVGQDLLVGQALEQGLGLVQRPAAQQPAHRLAPGAVEGGLAHQAQLVEGVEGHVARHVGHHPAPVAPGRAVVPDQVLPDVAGVERAVQVKSAAICAMRL